jgi:DNA-binding transcriptional ArsR family regulator
VAQDSATASQLTISDPKVMRALAHPARFAILQYLSTDRAATATECAEVVGLTPSAMSYHLRALAKAGLIEEAPSRGDGRERVWRGVAAGFTVDGSRNADDEVSAAQREVIQAFMANNDAEVLRWLDRVRDEPLDWYDATIFRRAHLTLTAAELKEVLASLDELLRPYLRATRPEPPAGARAVSMVYRAVPMNPPEEA